MRPRLITAENQPARFGAQPAQLLASMRPRLITAENRAAAPRRGGARARFNEAAAHHRGEPPQAVGLGRRHRRFNEAAAHHRGEPYTRRVIASTRICFNEAAAHHRGEPFDPDDSPFNTSSASMRPRLITAENLCAGGSCGAIAGGFNEAAAHHRGEPTPRGRTRTAARMLQ